MRHTRLRLESSLLALVILIAAASFAGCQRGNGNANTQTAGGGNANTSAGDATPTPTDTATPVTTPTGETAEKKDDNNNPPESSQSETFLASAQRFASNVSINVWKIPKESSLWYKLKDRDRVSTDPLGEAIVRVTECTEVYVFPESGMKLPPCSRSNFLSRNSKCFTNGFGAVSHSQRQSCRADIKSVATGSAQIVMLGTWYALWYDPAMSKTLLIVFGGQVKIWPVIDQKKWTLGEPSVISAGEIYVTKPGPTPDVTNGVPERKPVSIVELASLYEPFNLGRWLGPLNDRLEIDMPNAPPLPPVPSDLPPSVNFEGQYVGRPRAQEVTVVNKNFEPITLAGLSVEGVNKDDFKVLSDDCKDVPVKGKCVVRVEFTPKAEGERDAQLSMRLTAGGVAQSLPLQGTGLKLLEPVVKLTPSALDFKVQKLQRAGDAQGIVISSEGTLPMEVTEVDIEGPGKGDYAITKNECKGHVIQKQCVIEVTFTPGSEGGRAANLSVRAEPVAVQDAIPDNLQKGITYNVPLTGVGASSVAAIQPGDLCFYRWKVIDPKKPADRAVYAVTVFSKGSVPLSVKSVQLEQMKGDFRIVSDTCTGKDVKDQCEVKVAFTPREANMRSGTLVINHDDAKSRQTKIPLQGVGKPRNWFKRFWDKLFGDKHAPC